MRFPLDLKFGYIRRWKKSLVFASRNISCPLPQQSADKYFLALEEAITAQPSSKLNVFE